MLRSLPLRARRRTTPVLLAAFVVLGFAGAANAAVLCVGTSAPATPSCTAGPYATIQTAINDAGANDTILVAAGTYAESPIINEDVILKSIAGAGTTIIELQTGPSYLGALEIGDNDVTVEGFTIRGRDANCAVGALANSNILLDPGNGNEVLIQNNRFEVGAADDGCSTGDDGFGIVTTYDTTPPNVLSLTVLNNVFVPSTTRGTRAFYINPDVDTFVFKGNQISGWFERRAITQAKSGTIESNVVDGQDLGGFGFGAYSEPDSTRGHATFRNNLLKGLTAAVTLFDPNDVTLECNDIRDNVTGVVVAEISAGIGNPATIHINNNSITGNTTGVADTVGHPADSIDATLNWWGCAAGPGNPSCDSVSGAAIDYTPFLSGVPGCVAPSTRQDKMAVLSEITGANNPTDDNKLNPAIKYLTESLDGSLWVDDSHVVSPKGDKVFQKEKDAVTKLKQLMNSANNVVPDATLLDWILRLVNGDRKLAAVAVVDHAGGNAKKLAKANDELAKGDADAAAGKYESAIEHYRNAWKQANDA